MRLNPKRLRAQRQQLDRKVRSAAGVRTLVAPKSGWIRATREALGMTAEQLGRALGVTKQAVLQLEASERSGTITLATLRRVAEKLGCEPFVALIPHTSLEEQVKAQARTAAARRLARVSHSMRLEAQGTTAEAAEDRIRELADELTAKSPTRIWDPA